jgi:hypothetical protein
LSPEYNIPSSSSSSLPGSLPPAFAHILYIINFKKRSKNIGGKTLVRKKKKKKKKKKNIISGNNKF